MAVNLRVSRSLGIGPRSPLPPGRTGRVAEVLAASASASEEVLVEVVAAAVAVVVLVVAQVVAVEVCPTPLEYSLTFSAQALNLFNDIDDGQPSGALIPTLNTATGLYGPGSRFLKSTALASGMFASPTSSAARRIFFQAAFS